MRSRQEMEIVRSMLEAGHSASEVARRSGVPLTTVLRWRSGRSGAFGLAPAVHAWRPTVDVATYAYLLGVYLGDGCVNEVRTSFQLVISLDAAHPEVVREIARAVAVVGDRPARTHPVAGTGCVTVTSGWKRWPEVFPQHGPGRKHERPIVLEDWQREVVDAHPQAFLRGLIHSDGCRTVNRFTTTLPSGRTREYAYARYFFSNLSPDIRALFCAACDALGLRWTQSNPRNISVAHRRSVAALDAFVGPKR